MRGTALGESHIIGLAVGVRGLVVCDRPYVRRDDAVQHGAAVHAGPVVCNLPAPVEDRVGAEPTTTTG